MPETPRRSALARTLVFPVLWVATAAWMAVAYARDPYVPALEDTRRYGHNGEGALATGIAVSLIELLVLLAVPPPVEAGAGVGRLGAGPLPCRGRSSRR